jgi:hypothetical protein
VSRTFEVTLALNATALLTLLLLSIQAAADDLQRLDLEQ